MSSLPIIIPHVNGRASGAYSGPMDPDAWKREVRRSPPTHFSVTVLHPGKEAGTVGFGLRISPTQSSHGSNSIYNIWRRWEDCLYFQDCLEKEYEQKARIKIKRIQSGKEVKKQGVYACNDAASSWDSLPPRPDPKTVAVDIQQHIPKLTKKGTLFRASQATIDQRHSELHACIDRLFATEVPTLIHDIRESQKVTDFFGYWQIDLDIAAEKQKKSFKTPELISRASLSSSVFSTYFNGGPKGSLPADVDATLVNPASPNKKVKYKAFSSSSFTVPRQASLVPSSPVSSRAGQSFSYSGSEDEKNISRRGSDTSSTSSSVGPSTPQSFDDFRNDPPISFGYNPDQPHYSGASGLEPLPADDELVATKSDSTPHGRRRRASNCASPEEKHDNRLSWMTTTSIAKTLNPAAYLNELGISEFSLPQSPSSSAFPRASVASFATFMTENSADAIAMPPGGSIMMSVSGDSRHKTRPDAEKEEEGAWSDGEGDLLDAYFNDAFGRPQSSVFVNDPAPPTASYPTSVSFRDSMFSMTSRSSMASSASSTPPWNQANRASVL